MEADELAGDGQAERSARGGALRAVSEDGGSFARHPRVGDGLDDALGELL